MARRASWTLVLAVLLGALIGGCSGARLAPRMPTGPGAETLPAETLPAEALPAETTARAPRLTRRGACCTPCTIGCWPAPPCRSTYATGSLSLLPNIGLGLAAGKVLSRSSTATWSAEVGGTWQFLDDEDFADDGNPGAGDWYQIRAGAKTSFNPSGRRHLTLRYGALWLQANGEPNILQRPGNYAGLYASVGFETDLTSRISAGPEIVVMAVTRDSEFRVRSVPQFNYRLTWWLDASEGTPLRRAPRGELYAGGVAIASPGFGGGLEAGQVFSRTPTGTWSFELQAGWQDTSDTLWFDGGGTWAQIRGGIKVSSSPCARAHWTLRAGAVWLRATAANSFLDRATDHVGGYVGVGYEVDLAPGLTTGPELSLLLVSPESRLSPHLVPQLAWHVLFNF